MGDVRGGMMMGRIVMMRRIRQFGTLVLYLIGLEWDI